MNPPDRSITFSGDSIAAKAAVYADGGGRLQVPLTGIVILERLVGEYTRRADLYEVSAELTLKDPFLVATEIYMMMKREYVKVTAARIITIEPDTAVTLDAPVHLVVDKGAEVLIEVGPFFEPRFAVYMSRHDRHILKMAFAPFIADGAVVRMIKHQPFYGAFAEFYRLRVIYGDADAVCSRRHTGHYNAAAGIFFVFELLDRALPAGAYRMHGGMPAKIGYVKAKRETGMEKVLPVSDFVRLVININDCHASSPGAVFFVYMPLKVFSEIFQCAAEGFHRPGSKGAECVPRTEEPGLLL